MKTNYIYKYKHVLFTLSAFLFFNSTMIFFTQTAGIKRFAIVEVIVDDTTMLHGDSIHFCMSKDGINSNFTFDTDNYDYPISKPRTKLIIPLSASINYGRIDFLDDHQQPLKSLNHDNNLFIFQPGDRVELHLSSREGGVFFTGKNAGKYNGMYKINSCDNIQSLGEFNTDIKLKKINSAYVYRKHLLDSIYALQTNILNQLKNEINKEVYDLIRLDCWAKYNQQLVDIYLSPFLIQRSEELPTAKLLFNKDYLNYKEVFFNDTALLVKSYYYCDFLVKKEKAFAIIMGSTNEISYYNNLKFGNINDAIDRHYVNGVLKDKVRLLSLYNINRVRQGDFADYLDAAISEAGNDIFKKRIIAFKDANGFLANAFPFALPDKNGRVYRLSDFKGKMVIMDFWFTGCHGCVGMGAVLKPIALFYKSNPNVVFISMSIDRNRDLWLKSLEEEIYCSKDEINLLAGMDRESSIYKHYDLQGCPTLIVISKEGKIISAAPPDPRIDAGVFKTFINKYL